MIKIFMLIYVMSHGQLSFKQIEVGSKTACEEARPDVIKTIIEAIAPDSLEVKCVEINLAKVA